MRDGQRGQLDVVRDAHGLPLIVPIAIGIAAFREAVGDQHGRYRLDALDADKMQIDGAEPAYVSVPQLRRVIEIEAGESLTDPDLEHDQAVAHDASAARLRNAASVPPIVAAPTPMVSSPIGTWPALPMPVGMTGEQYLVGEALRGLVQINRQQGDAHAHQLGQLSAMASSTLAAIPPLLLATTAHAERVETLLAELLLRQQGITPPSPPPPAAPTPTAPPQPPPPPTAPTVMYAMPRNAAFVDDAYDDEADDDLDDAPIEAQGDEDMIAKINKLVEKVGLALAPVANVAQMVIGAGLGRGLFGGGADTPRNGAGDEPAEPEAESEAPESSLGHLRTSHVLAISHELGAQDGSIFRTMIRAMEPADRRMFVDRLCAMPLDEAVPFAVEKVEWLKARIARSRARSADAPIISATDDVIDVEPIDGNPDQEHDTRADSDPFPADTTPDQEHDADTASHDHDPDNDPTDLDDRERERDPHVDNFADTDPPIDDYDAEAEIARDATTTDTQPINRSPMTTPATAPDVPRPVTPDVAAHMKQMAKHLKFTEILQAQQLVNNTSIAERNAWIERLMALDPKDAATVVRAELARRAGR